MAGSLAQWFRDIADWIGDDEPRAKHALTAILDAHRGEVTPTPPVDPGST